MGELKTQIFDTNTTEWEDRPNKAAGNSYKRMMLHTDDDTGMRVNLADYPAGFTTPRHEHPCGHGMFVLEGTLHTPQGDYGPGTFVWYPEGVVTEHGATENEHVKVLFITNKAFDIFYK